MSHVVIVGRERRVLRDVIELAYDGGALRVLRAACGDAVVVTSTAATRDGLPVVGNLTVVDWGTAALVRASGTRIEIAWQPHPERCLAPAGWCCRLCFGAIDAGEAAVVCTCTHPFHVECDAVRISCPACGGEAVGDPT